MFGTTGLIEKEVLLALEYLFNGSCISIGLKFFFAWYAVLLKVFDDVHCRIITEFLMKCRFPWQFLLFFLTKVGWWPSVKLGLHLVAT